MEFPIKLNLYISRALIPSGRWSPCSLTFTLIVQEDCYYLYRLTVFARGWAWTTEKHELFDGTNRLSLSGLADERFGPWGSNRDLASSSWAWQRMAISLRSGQDKAVESTTKVDIISPIIIFPVTDKRWWSLTFFWADIRDRQLLIKWIFPFNERSLLSSARAVRWNIFRSGHGITRSELRNFEKESLPSSWSTNWIPVSVPGNSQCYTLHQTIAAWPRMPIMHACLSAISRVVSCVVSMMICILRAQ